MKTVSNGERNSRRLRIWELALLIGLAVFLLTGALSLRSQDQLADKVVRLHVLANSDSEEDQALKLKVRDRVLERATELLEQAADRKEAEALLRGQLLELEEIAAEEIAANGYDYPVSVELEPTQFPTKEYDGFALPAGPKGRVDSGKPCGFLRGVPGCTEVPCRQDGLPAGRRR